MMTLKEIRDALQDRIPGKVADACGVHYNTVRRIRDDPNANPTHAVVVALSEYLERGRVVRDEAKQEVLRHRRTAPDGE